MRKSGVLFLLVGLFFVFSLNSEVFGKDIISSCTLTVIPNETILSPALIAKPIQFKGSGFLPNEMVIVEMVLPTGVKIRGIDEGQLVGLAYETADKQGNFTASMAPTATLNWFFQVEWSSNLSPDFKTARPLPPGKYEILATGASSEAFGKATLEIMLPPKKEP